MFLNLKKYIYIFLTIIISGLMLLLKIKTSENDLMKAKNKEEQRKNKIFIEKNKEDEKILKTENEIIDIILRNERDKNKTTSKIETKIKNSENEKIEVIL